MGKLQTKQAIFTMTMLFALFVFALPVYANTVDLSVFETYMADEIADKTPADDAAKVTGGISKPTTSTFDTIRTIRGTAPKESTVTIAVYTYDAKEEAFDMVQDYVSTIGQSGLFSKTIDLSIGQNFIAITTASAGGESVQIALINRKALEIKKELEHGTVLPGKTITPTGE